MIEVDPAALTTAAGIVRGVAGDVGPAPAPQPTGSARLDAALRRFTRTGGARAEAVAVGLQAHAGDLTAGALRYTATDATAVAPW